MNYHYLIDTSQTKNISAIWNATYVRDASYKEVTRALAYKILRHGSDGGSFYTPQAIEVQSFVNQICETIDISALNIENSGFRWNISVSPKNFSVISKIEISSKLVDKIAVKLSENRGVSEKFREVKRILHRNHRSNLYSLGAGFLVGLVGAPTMAFLANAPLSYGGFLSFAAVGAVIASVIGFSVSNGVLGSSRRNVFRSLESSACPIAYKELISTAMEAESPQIIVIDGDQSEKTIEFAPETKTNVVKFIEGIVHDPKNWGFKININSTHQELTESRITLHVWPDRNYLLPNGGKRKRKKFKLTRSRKISGGSPVLKPA